MRCVMMRDLNYLKDKTRPFLQILFVSGVGKPAQGGGEGRQYKVSWYLLPQQISYSFLMRHSEAPSVHIYSKKRHGAVSQTEIKSFWN